jgi:hypothetical protein
MKNLIGFFLGISCALMLVAAGCSGTDEITNPQALQNADNGAWIEGNPLNLEGQPNYHAAVVERAAMAGGGGFDEYGYNYNGKVFRGLAKDADRDSSDNNGYAPDTQLFMKWNKLWVLNAWQDGAWCTNEFSGVYGGFSWNYLVKIKYIAGEGDIDEHFQTVTATFSSDNPEWTIAHVEWLLGGGLQYYFPTNADDDSGGGFNEYGYNYEANLFSGLYCNVYTGRDGYPPYTGDEDSYVQQNPTVVNTWYWPYRDVELVMKWNDMWMDENGNRPDYTDPNLSPVPWTTNHMRGSYIGDDGKTHEWVSFTKIVGVGAPPPAPEPDPFECCRIWTNFIIIQDIYNDPYGGYNGNIVDEDYVNPGPNGFGYNW